MSLTRRQLLRTGFAAAAAPALSAKKQPIADKNVLFIAVDDLRPDLGCYGHPQVKTPNIDRLAARGLTFTRAYCQQAVCSPSRTSLMTGLRPDSTGVHDLQTHFRRYVPNAVTLPEHFRKFGYETTAFGKIFHKPQLDDPQSWSIAPWIADNRDWNTPENAAFYAHKWDELRAAGYRSTERFYFEPDKRTPANPEIRGWGMPSWRAPDVLDEELPDGKTAAAAVKALGELRDKRFFVAVGFLKPHLPFVAPKKYFDLYPPDSIDLTDNPAAPDGAPTYALHDSEELRGYYDIPREGPVPADKARELIRGYYASISFVDAQIGKLLDALDDLGLAESTAVVLWGDHGYHLGDHGLWNKHTNFENATRAPLIVSYPGQRGVARKTPALTELVDIYPSLCDICNVTIPNGLEGSAFTPLFEDPERLWKRAVFSQYPKQIPGLGEGMGYSLRTSRFRYTEWSAPGSPYKGVELYDYKDDPGETRNIASRPENASLVNGLAGILAEGWRAALPPTDPRSGASS